MDGSTPSRVLRPRKEVAVSYVPDTIIETIIPNENPKSDGRRRRTVVSDSSVNDYIGFNNGSAVKPKLSRSGRQITSKLQSLSLNESNSPRKSAPPHVETDIDDRNDVEDNHEKPEENLFGEEEIDGGAIFSFRTPKRQNGMVTKASESVTKVNKRHTFGEEKRHYSLKQHETTPSRSEFLDAVTGSAAPKTPYALRKRLRQRIAMEAEKQELDILEDSGSEYNPSFSDTDSDFSESEEEPVEYGPSHPSPVNDKQHSPAKKSRQQLKDYVFSADDYFDRRYSKIMTSNNTLNKLKKPKLNPCQVTSLLHSIPRKHLETYTYLENSIKSCYNRWMFAMSEGYNIMLHGLGSKRQILADFHKKCLKNAFTIVVHGYFPDNMVKEILVSIASSCLKITNIPSQPHEIIEVIGEKMKSRTVIRVFLLVSNLDGKFLQNDKSQALISQLVSLPKVHMVATIDHINSPLLWDQSKLSAFNFIWEDATNFQPYTEETSYEGSLMVNWSGGIAISSLKNVFASLTSNSRKVFKILLKYQLENHGPKYSGMHFSDLYRECRAGFVVSSDLALRTLLTEFIDHELVKWKKETDHLIITVDMPVLKQFQLEMD